MNPSNIKRQLSLNYSNNAVTELTGPPGGGKTSVIAEWADEQNLAHGGSGPADVRIRARLPDFASVPPSFGMIVSNLSAADVPDVAGVGIPQRDPHGVDSLVMMNARPAMWPVPALHGKRGIVVLDEFRSADDSVRKPTSTLLLEGWLNGRSLPDGWVVVLASNRVDDNSGANREFAMLNNRRNIINFDASFRDWARWANKVGLPPVFISFAEKHADLVFTSKVPETDGSFSTPRSFVKACENWISALTGAPAALADQAALGRYRIDPQASLITDWLPEHDKAFITEAIAGWIGEACARQLYTHIVFAKEMPDLDDILADPMKAKIPSNKAAAFVVGHMASSHADENTFGALVKYVKRLGDDICIVFVQNSLQRKPRLYSTKAFSEWAAQNATFASRVMA